MEWNEMSQKQKQNLIRLGLLAILGIFLLLIGGKSDSVFVQKSVDEIQNLEDSALLANSFSANMEHQLEQTLEQVKGAGNVTVQITVEDFGYKEYARDVQRVERSTVDQDGENQQQTTEMQENQTVVQQSGQNSALLVQERMPEIRGVLIVATGANQASVQERLLYAAATVLQISTEQIVVLPGKGEEAGA